MKVGKGKLPIFARSMKQKRYSKETVGTTKKSIFIRSFASSDGSKWTRGLPYLLKLSVG